MLIECTTTDRGLSSRDRTDLEAYLKDKLQRYEDRITRVQVHIEDINGPRNGIDTKCSLELRPAGLDPLASTAKEVGTKEAVRAATAKALRVLESRFGRLSDEKN